MCIYIWCHNQSTLKDLLCCAITTNFDGATTTCQILRSSVELARKKTCVDHVKTMPNLLVSHETRPEVRRSQP